MFQMLLGDTVTKYAKPKRFDLVHQTVSPCERVGSGDETRGEPGKIYVMREMS